MRSGGEEKSGSERHPARSLKDTRRRRRRRKDRGFSSPPTVAAAAAKKKKKKEPRLEGVPQSMPRVYCSTFATLNANRADSFFSIGLLFVQLNMHDAVKRRS